MLCAICGKEIKYGKNRDHIFPRAIAKWEQAYISPEELQTIRSLIGSKANIIPVHSYCNVQKDDAIPWLYALHIEPAHYLQLLKIKEQLSPYINDFLQHKRIIQQKQKNKCYSCNKPLKTLGTIRRIDPTKPRIWSNACIVCTKCNCTYEGWYQKRKDKNHAN